MTATRPNRAARPNYVIQPPYIDDITDGVEVAKGESLTRKVRAALRGSAMHCLRQGISQTHWLNLVVERKLGRQASDLFGSRTTPLSAIETQSALIRIWDDAAAYLISNPQRYEQMVNEVEPLLLSLVADPDVDLDEKERAIIKVALERCRSITKNGAVITTPAMPQAAVAEECRALGVPMDGKTVGVVLDRLHTRGLLLTRSRGRRWTKEEATRKGANESRKGRSARVVELPSPAAVVAFHAQFQELQEFQISINATRAQMELIQKTLRDNGLPSDMSLSDEVWTSSAHTPTTPHSVIVDGLGEETPRERENRAVA